MKRKILYVIPSLLLGGLETFIMNLVKNIDMNKYEIHFSLMSINIEDYYKKEAEELGVIIHKSEKDLYKNKFKRLKMYYEHIYNLVKKYNFDVVHVNSSTSLAYRACKAAKKAGCKCVIFHSHNTSAGYGKYLNLLFKGKARKWSDYQFACGKDAGVWLFGKKFLTSNKSRVINNGFDLSKYKFDLNIRNEYRSNLNIKDDTKTFIMVSSLSPAKNHLFMINVFNKYIETNPNSLLLIAGDGPLKIEIENKIKELKLENNVKLLGRRNDINKLLNAADVYLMPSLYEGMPTSAIEAQCNGLPSLLSNTIDNQVKIINETKLLSLGNIDMWVNEMKHIYINQNREKSILEVKNAKYDIKDVADIILKLYEDNIND